MKEKIPKQLKMRFLRIIQELKDNNEMIVSGHVHQYINALYTIYRSVGDDLEDFISFCYNSWDYYKAHPEIYWMMKPFEKLPLHKLSHIDFLTIELSRYRESKNSFIRKKEKLTKEDFVVIKKSTC